MILSTREKKKEKEKKKQKEQTEKKRKKGKNEEKRRKMHEVVTNTHVETGATDNMTFEPLDVP